MAYAAASFLVPSGYHEMCAMLRGTSFGSLGMKQFKKSKLMWNKTLMNYLKILIVLADGGSSPKLSLVLAKYSS